MGRSKNRLPEIKKRVPGRKEKQIALAELLSEDLLKRCDSELQVLCGGLVWAKAPGSIYWPGVIVSGDPEDGEESSNSFDDTSRFAFVMYLEPKFRLSIMGWSRIIPVDIEQFEEQTQRVIELNLLEKGKKMGPEQTRAFTESCKLVRTFNAIPKDERQKAGEEKCREFKELAAANSKKVPKNKTLRKTPVLAQPASDDKTLGSVDVTKPRESESVPAAPRLSAIYELRPTIKTTKAWDNSVVKPDSKTLLVVVDKDNSEPEPATPSGVKKVQPRPEEGLALRKWTEEKFALMDKQLRFQTTEFVSCASCRGVLKQEDGIASCHDYPFHKTCLRKLVVSNGQGEITAKYKCEDCFGQRCFVCKKPNEDELELPQKCFRCDLRFHRDCLLQDWPQAEIIGSCGTITCPQHFCHICKAEHKHLGKVRNYKIINGRSLKCLFCLATYHKGTCIPAGTGNSIMAGGQFLICPRHKESLSPQKKVKRLGCFACQKKISSKTANTVGCTLCPIFYHLACVYGEEQTSSGISVEEFSADFKCLSCSWGTFPLYGQVVWYQQPGSSYWPSIVMYPKGETAYVRDTVGVFGVQYCGYQNPLTFPNCRSNQTIPLEIANKDFLKKLKLYSNTKIESAAKEAFHLLKLSESFRDESLPPPEPVYKKIDKNLIRTPSVEPRDRNKAKSKARNSSKSKVADEDEEACVCGGQSPTGNVCTPGSGCFNRDAAIECTDENCSGKERCRNRMFSTKTDHKEHQLEPFVSSSSKGWGLKTTVKLEEGSFVIEYIGEILSKTEVMWRVSRKTDEDPLYFLEIDAYTYIDAEYLGNSSRLINHSCNPNCRTEKYSSSNGRVVVGIFALRDIEVEEELTFNYNYGPESGFMFTCRCKGEDCKGHIGRADLKGNEENLVPGKSAATNPNVSDWKWEDECSSCGARGELLMCDFEGCSKSYHLHCLGIITTPRGTWHCPSHGEDGEEIEPEDEVPEPPKKKPKMSNKVTIVPCPPKPTSTSNVLSTHKTRECKTGPKESGSGINGKVVTSTRRKSSPATSVPTPMPGPEPDLPVPPPIELPAEVPAASEPEPIDVDVIVVEPEAEPEPALAPPAAGEIPQEVLPAHVPAKSLTRKRPFRDRNLVTASIV